MTREGHSRSHESSSYKVHHVITQSGKVNQTLPTFQRYGLARYKKCKTDIVIPKECDPSKEQEKERVQGESEP